MVVGKWEETPVGLLTKCSYCGEETEENVNLSEVTEKIAFWSSFSGHETCMKELEKEV